MPWFFAAYDIDLCLMDRISYHAFKKVKVRSVRLGLIVTVVYALIFAYIVIYQVLYRSRHLALATPTGTARIQAQRPVKDHCNPLEPSCEADFTPRELLRYCSQHLDAAGSRDQSVHPCEYWDEHQMNPTQHQGTYLMPTRVTVQHQQPTGKCGIESKELCTNIYSFKERGNTTYIADVDRFTLLIDHAFTMPRLAIDSEATIKRGSSVDFPGYWEQCEDPDGLNSCELVRIHCLPGTICDGKAVSNKFVKGAIPGIIGLSVGDVIPIGELLSLAGIDLDKGRNKEGESWRKSGVAIQVDVDYQNRQAFRLDFWNPGELHYVYRVNRLPVESYKTTSTSILPNGDRILHDVHGIYIVIGIVGNVAYFDATELQILIATCVTLLTIANLSVNLYAESMWRHKKRYAASKYDTTVDLNYDDRCCCTQLGGSAAEEANPDYGQGTTQDFINHFSGLDGEALQWAGAVLHVLHDRLDEQDQVDVRHTLQKLRASEAGYSYAPTDSEGSGPREFAKKSARSQFWL